MWKCLGSIWCFLLILVSASAVTAAELTSLNYAIYSGDLNNDGMKDFYFHGSEVTVFEPELRVDPAPPNFVIDREAGAYGEAVVFSLTDSQIAS